MREPKQLSLIDYINQQTEKPAGVDPPKRRPDLPTPGSELHPEADPQPTSATTLMRGRSTTRARTTKAGMTCHPTTMPAEPAATSKHDDNSPSSSSCNRDLTSRANIPPYKPRTSNTRKGDRATK